MTRRVLIVEDDPANRELLRRWVERWGYKALTAEGASDALEMMLSDPVSIMLVDVKLGSAHDGFWLIERVKAKWPQTVFIMAAGYDHDEAIERSKSLGVIDYVVKPFQAELLRHALDKAERARIDRPA